jgi:secreted trypsin-like serine protease
VTPAKRPGRFILRAVGVSTVGVQDEAVTACRPMFGVNSSRRLLGAIGVGLAVTALSAASADAGPPSKRIVGGNVANPADWPWIAALMAYGDEPGNQFCGATVIAERAALTAAHCVFGVDAPPVSSLSVVVGRPDLSTSTGTVIDVDRALVHPRYKRRGLDDFAVLHLGSDAPSPYAKLPTTKQARKATALGRRTLVAGWGSTAPNGSLPSEVLMETRQTVIKSGTCARAFPWYEGKSEICTRGARIPGRKGRTSSCIGDSGGPLIADTAPGNLLVGVVAYGGRRCGVKKPTVYARVAHALGFIKSKAGLP